jgi:hypothetical protein
MWWRALGVAAVLVCVGVAGGYAVAERTQAGPSRADAPTPVPAASPSVPTPPVHPVFPDPSADPLDTDLATHPEVLRLPRRGAGVVAQVPDGWRTNPSSDTWTFAKEGNPVNTFGLRIQLLFGLRQSVTVVKGARIAALQQAQAEGHLFDLDISEQTGDAFQASYIDEEGFFRVTMERYVAFEGDTAYAVVAATGRSVDLDGVQDLVSRTAGTMTELRDGEKAPSGS